MRFIDLTGQKFERLTVLSKAETKNKKIRWNCLCECGNKKIIGGSELKSLRTKSCGCYNKEVNLNRIRNKLYNNYDLSNDYGIGYTQKGEEFYFDLEDYDKIKDYCWGKRFNYIRCLKKNEINKRVNIHMHNIIMDTKSNNKTVVDHINGLCYDNRKSNLRIISQLDNMKNQKIRTNNKSGYKGVNFHKRNNKWCARISLNNKRILLGYFDDIDSAIKARKEGEEKYYGKFSRNNKYLLNGSR